MTKGISSTRRTSITSRRGAQLRGRGPPRAAARDRASYPGFDAAGMASHVGRVARASTRGARRRGVEFEEPETCPRKGRLPVARGGARRAPRETLRRSIRRRRSSILEARAADGGLLRPLPRGRDRDPSLGRGDTHDEHLPIPADLAADGIDYTLSAWVPMQGAKLEADLGGDGRLRGARTPATAGVCGPRTARSSRRRGRGDAGTTLDGDVSDLFLTLWKRIDLPSPSVEVSGDPAPADRLLALDYVINPKTTPFH